MSPFAPVPSPVEEPSLEALEWPKLRKRIAGHAHSQPAREWLLQLIPSRDLAWISHRADLAAETRLMLREGVRLPLTGLFDPGALLETARIAGAALEGDQVRSLLPLLASIVEWSVLLAHPPEALAGRLPELTKLGEPPPSAKVERLEASLRSRFSPDGSLADDASPGLRRLRRAIERQKQEIAAGLKSSLRRLSESGEAQQDVIAIRGERYVIPVKAEFKRRVPGVIHGASSTGHTVYVEPLETIDQNNELVRLMEEEQEEMRRIFQAMTKEIDLEAAAIAHGASALLNLDALAAIAGFAGSFDCIRAKIGGEGPPELVLKQARHPLLENRLRQSLAPIVPLSLALTGAERQLIVSGPNTGGKTIVLKTTGLLAIMAQAGIPVPAADAVFPLFDGFYAGIGDAQSIELDLSTFSARIANLNRIAGRAGPGTLVLLDELGTATDPEEGAALGVAISRHFLELGAWSLISTHHTALKVYAAGQPGALNASVGFDERTLQPTYELRLGVPGASAGLNIARRLGLSPAILERARAQLDTQTKDIGRFLDELHAQLAGLREQQAALKARERELQEAKRRLDREGMNEWRKKVSELEKKLHELLDDFAYRTQEAAAGLASRQPPSKTSERGIARLRREFRDQFDAAVVANHSGADQGDPNAQPHLIQKISVGDAVRIKTIGKSGAVLRQIERDVFEVAIGAMKMKVRRSEIAQAGPSAADPPAAARRRGISVSLSHSEIASQEINVIGRSADEAIAEADRFLDRAYLAGLPRIRIVHGIGMGVLKKALRAQLASHPHVAQIAEATPSEGGAGATIVELKP